MLYIYPKDVDHVGWFYDTMAFVHVELPLGGTNVSISVSVATGKEAPCVIHMGCVQCSDFANCNQALGILNHAIRGSYEVFSRGYNAVRRYSEKRRPNESHLRVPFVECPNGQRFELEPGVVSSDQFFYAYCAWNATWTPLTLPPCTC